MTAFGSTKIYNQQPDIDIQRSTFDLSRNHKTTMDAGKLVPLFCEEVLPGDTISLDDSIFARISTPIVPIMDDIFFKMHYFFVPTRLVWENAANFFGERVVAPDGSMPPEKYIPQVSAPLGFTEGSNYDYMGIPTKIPKLSVNALPLRALRLIAYEWYRDQNLQLWIEGNAVGDGPDNPDLYSSLFVRNANHDYFTSCLPWPQKGPAVQLALASRHPITLVSASDSTNPMRIQNASTGAAVTSQPLNALPSSNLGAAGNNVVIDPNGRYELDLTDNIGLTVNSIRFAFQIQKLYEKDARGGTRYIELILAHFGVQNPDFRLQRPEYLGMSKRQVNFTSVPQTSETTTDSETPQGNLAAYGTMSGVDNGFTNSFTEHGYVIGIGFFYQHNSYQQGLSRMWSRKSRFDFYWPTLAHLGEQAVLNKEIYAQGPDLINASTGVPYDEEAFGYIPRWDEYRQGKNYVTGKMRSNATGTVDLWHLANKYNSLPALNDSFIREQLGKNLLRSLAVNTEPQFIVDAYFKVSATRPMPMFSVPGLVDHF